MLFYNVMRYIVLILGIILVLMGLNSLFSLGIGVILPIVFVIVFVFALGLGFYHYCIEKVVE